MLTDPHAPLREKLIATVLGAPGQTDPGTRKAVFSRNGVPEDLTALVDKIHDHAYKVTDDDVARAQERYGDDAMFEVIVSAALGASEQRLRAGLDALEKA